jgi:hypothetical protein
MVVQLRAASATLGWPNGVALRTAGNLCIAHAAHVDLTPGEFAATWTTNPPQAA